MKDGLYPPGRSAQRDHDDTFDRMIHPPGRSAQRDHDDTFDRMIHAPDVPPSAITMIRSIV
jgi:hypothetical protein